MLDETWGAGELADPAACPSRRVLVFGRSGQIGSALCRALELRRARLAPAWDELRWHRLRREPAETWAASLVARLHDAWPGPWDFVYASGVTDPSLPPEQIRESNLAFPQAVIDATRDAGDFRHLTLGTIQERFPDLCRGNPYLDSKLELGDRVRRAAGERPGRLLHVRLHTLYGADPKPHLFLGQIARSLRDDTPLAMSSGEQLREYHHVDDVCAALANLLAAREWDFGPVMEVNSGAPVRLADLARAAFQAFGREDLLRVGAIPSPALENRAQVFPRSPAWLLPHSREPVAGVIDCLRRHLGAV